MKSPEAKAGQFRFLYFYKEESVSTIRVEIASIIVLVRFLALGAFISHF